MLLENENLSEGVFFILAEMKQNLEIVSRDYRYERTTAFKMMEAWKKDLYKQLIDLGYGELANVSFCGYNTDKNEPIAFEVDSFEDIGNKFIASQDNIHTTCCMCGRLVKKISPRTKYCTKCSKELHKERDREYQKKKYKENVRN